MTSADDKLQTAAAPAETDSGTGWPAEPESHDTEALAADPWAARGNQLSTAQLPVTDVTADAADKSAPPRKRRHWWRFWRVGALGARAFWLAMVAGVVVILLVLFGIVVALPHLSNPFKAQTTDRSQPVLLVSIQDLARFEAASGNFQVIIDVQQDRSFIPDILFSERSLFVAAGTVDAYVDFAHIGAGDIVASADQKTVTVTLPAPQLEPPNLDPNRSYVYAESQGLVNKLQDLFGGDPNKLNELYQLGQQKIAAAAVDSQLPQRAEQNTRQMLHDLLTSLGFVAVTINFPAP